MPDTPLNRETIQAARKDAGLSQEGLARLLGVSTNAVRAWESKKNGRLPKGLYAEVVRRWMRQVEKAQKAQE